MTGYYLLDHPNRHAPAREDGRKFWGYASRRRCQHGIRGPHLIVIHTAENLPDFTPPDTGAEGVAQYGASTDRAASWHVVCDSDSIVPSLPDDYTAFHVRNFNRCGLGLEIATRAHQWDEVPDEFKAKILDNAATVCTEWAVEHNIPLVLLSPEAARAGARGFIGHAALDPTRRSDPGPSFPWNAFLAMIQIKLGDQPGPMEVSDVAYAFRDPAEQGSPVFACGVPGQPAVWHVDHPDKLFYLIAQGAFGPPPWRKQLGWKNRNGAPDWAQPAEPPTVRASRGVYPR